MLGGRSHGACPTPWLPTPRRRRCGRNVTSPTRSRPFIAERFTQSARLCCRDVLHVRAISREICAEICDAVRFTDPSGGSADSFTLCIAHSELIASNCSAIIIDLIREAKPPFSPEGIIAEF